MTAPPRPGQAPRSVAAWLYVCCAMIFAMVVIAYGFRDVLRDDLLPAAMVQVDPETIELRRASQRIVRRWHPARACQFFRRRSRY